MNNKVKLSKGSQPIKPNILRQRKKVLQLSNNTNQQRRLSLVPSKNLEYFNQLSQYRFLESDLNFESSKKRLSLQRTQHTAGTSRYSTLMKQQKNGNKHIGKDIRSNVDQSLRKIYQFLDQRELSLQLTNNVINHTEILQGPKLQSNLVEKYLQFMFQQYQIPKSLDNLNTQNYIHNFERTTHIRQKYLSTNQDPIVRDQKKRKLKNPTAKELKSQFIKQMHQKPDSSYKPAKNNFVKDCNKQNYGQNNSYLLLEPQHVPKNHDQKTQSRYCLNCEHHILDKNIQYHQKYACQSLNKVYSKNKAQLRNMIIQKILRMKKQIEKLYQQIFGDQDQKYFRNKLRKLKENTKKYIGFLQKNFKSNQKRMYFKKQQLQQQYFSTTKSYQQSILKLYEKLKKLQWFILTLISLQQKYHFNRENIRNQNMTMSIKKFQVYGRNSLG